MPMSKQLTSKIPAVHFSLGRGVTVLALDGDWLRVLHMKGSGTGGKISLLYAQKLENVGVDVMISSLRKALKSQRAEKSDIIISTPASFLTGRTLSLPSGDAAEIKEMVALQTEKVTPYAKEETLSYHRITEKDKSGYSRVFLVTAHQDIVLQAVKLIESFRGRIKQVSSDIDGLVNWFQKTRGKGASSQANYISCIADVDFNSTNVMMIKQGEPYFNRNIPIGFSSLSDSDQPEAWQRFAEELKRSFELFDAENLKLTCNEIFVSGLANSLPSIADFLQKETHLMVNVIEPFEGMNMTQAAKDMIGSGYQVSYSSLMGLAIKPSPGDLMPKAVKLRHSFESRVRALMVLGFQVLIGIVLLSAFALSTAHKDLTLHAWLTKQYKKDMQEADKIKSSMDHIALLEDRLKERGTLLTAMAEINRLTPESILWNSFTYTKDEQIIIRGVSRSIPKVFELVTALEQLSLFDKPEARRVTKKKVDGEDLTDFEIICPLVTEDES